MDLFSCDDYKQYVHERVKQAPGGGHGQYRKIAHALHAHTTTISQVFNGSKDLTLEQAVLLGEYFGLSELERRYFINLVHRERAGSEKLRAHYVRELAQIRKEALQAKSRVVPGKDLDEAAKSLFYSQWYYSAIALLTSIPRYRSPEEIAAVTRLSLKRVRDVLRFLVSIGLCSEKGGRYEMGSARTHIEKDSPLSSRHHANWRLKAIEYQDHLSDQEIGFTAPVTLSYQDAKKVHAEVLQLIQRVSGIVAPSPSEALYCLNLDWFEVKSM